MENETDFMMLTVTNGGIIPMDDGLRKSKNTTIPL
jgi:hypothetical protein